MEIFCEDLSVDVRDERKVKRKEKKVWLRKSKIHRKRYYFCLLFFLAVFFMIRRQAAFWDCGYVFGKEEEITLNVMLRYDFVIPEDFELIARRADQIIWEKIGVHVNFIPVLPLTQKNARAIAEKEGVTIDVSSKIAGDFSYQELDDLLPLYGQDILKIATKEEIENTMRNGHLYEFPSKADYAASAGIAFRKDILEKYEIDPAMIQTLEDVDEVFTFLRDKEPQLIMTSPLWTQSGFWLRYRFFDVLPNTIFDFARDSGELVNVYDTEPYRHLISMIRKWYKLGYLPDELPLQNIKGSEMVKAGKLFSYFCAWKPGIEWEESVSSGQDMVIVPLREPYITNASVRISPWGITQECNHPEEAMRFLNLLYSDAELVNLLIYGIEGMHYEILEDGTIDFPEGVTAETSRYNPNMGWSFPNQMLSYIWNGNDPDLWEKTKQFEKEAETAQAIGFWFDDTKVREQNEKLNEIAKKYAYGLESGMLDPDIYLPQMLAEMEEAGMSEVKQEIAQQYDEWKKKMHR